MNRITKLKDLKDYWNVLKRSFQKFGSNNPVQLAGTTAYVSIFSIAPILIIIISVFGIITGNEVIREKLFTELNLLIGSDSSVFLERAIENYNIMENSRIGTIFGVLLFLISATTLFSIMQNSINFIWRVKVKSNLKQSIFKLVRERLLSFGLILSLGFVLVISLIIDASIAYLSEFFNSIFKINIGIVTQLINLALLLVIISTVFAFIYKYLPDINVRWSASWFGAIVATVMFSIGKFIIGLIVGNSQLGVVYGAASSLAVILVWIFYVSIIFYFGVHVSYQFSTYFKHDQTPLNFAVPFEINKIT